MSLAAQQQIRVLHVDDEPDFADLTGTFLEREEDRFTVETATSADDGLEIINDRPPDCVVSDYNMPGTDGLEFLQAVREDNPDLPFILYTGKGSEAVASEAISSEVTDYLQKGSGTGQYELLANRISNAVEQHQAKRRVELSHQAMDTANEGLSLVRPDGTFSYVNSAFAHLFEYDPDELIGEHWTVLYHNEEAERLDNDILPAVREHGYWSGETVRLTKQEDRLVTDHRLSRTAEDVIVCTAQDITPERTGSTGQSGELDLLVDTMEGHAFYTLDHEGYVTSWNEGAERLTGYSATEILGAHVGQFFTEEDRDRGLPEELIKAAKTDGMVTDQGWRIRNDDSKIRTADTISASYDASGTIRGFGVMMRESTADPLAAELHRKTDYLDVIMEYSVQPLFMKDTSGEYLLANREFKQLYDIQDETVIGRTDYDLHPEEMAEKVWASDRQVLETDEPVEIEEHVVVEGEERTYLSSKVPVYFDDDSDEPDAVFGMATDITERKEREQELRRSKRAMDEAPVGITITDPDQDDNPIIYANNGFRSLTGYADDEILGRNCRFLQGEDTSPEAIATMRKTVDNEERVTVQLRNYRKDGTEFWNRISIAPVHDDEGSVVNFVGFQQNITARKRKERQLERQLAQFEHFGGVVSHDLRTPLETVRGRVELARETGDIGHLQQAETALERLDALIDDLANVMREGELVNDVRSVALDEVVHAVWDTIETADETLTIEVNTSIQADEDALTRLVENLFKNAFEHGGADVSVTVGVLADGFYVEDDGPGVPVDERDRVFEAGYSTKPEGHGFGLASVRHLAVAHGWDITVTEGSDGGARFELTDIEIDDA